MDGQRAKKLLIAITLLAVGVMLGVYIDNAFMQDMILVQTENAGSFSMQVDTSPSPSFAPSAIQEDHVLLPIQTQMPEPSAEIGSILEPTTTSSENTGMLDLNTATTQELEQLPGIGEVLAQRIVDYRETNGGFYAAEELLDIKGIGEKTYAKLKDYVEVRN